MKSKQQNILLAISALLGITAMVWAFIAMPHIVPKSAGVAIPTTTAADQSPPPSSKLVAPPQQGGGNSNSVTSVTPAENTISVLVTAGDVNVKLTPKAGTLFYDALVSARGAGKISFDGKIYPTLGFFVTDIGTLHSSLGKNMIYYVNGKEATVGVSSYVPHDGDSIVWKLD